MGCRGNWCADHLVRNRLPALVRADAPYAPPALRVETTAIAPAPEGFLVALKIRNEGGSTAASVHVGGELVDDGQVIEQSETVLDYVPENSQREAFLLFSRDPQAFSLRLRVKGMTEP